ncbi:MAG TPA: hypothetical protein VFZ77_06840 [Acidimicrobiales bacterium]
MRAAGATPVVCDVFDAGALGPAVADHAPDLVMHQLTDLPDEAGRIPEFGARNARIRRVGTRNLLAAAGAAGCRRVVAQSVAWPLPGDAGAAVEEHERMVLDAGGVVVRYGQFHGPGTYHPGGPPPGPSIHIDDAAARTLDALDAPAGVVSIADP